MIDVILSGANGRMGQVLQTLIAQQSEMQVVAGIDRLKRIFQPIKALKRVKKRPMS